MPSCTTAKSPWPRASFTTRSTCSSAAAATRPLAARAQQRWAEGVSGFAKPLFGSPTGWRGYALGLALGFIPCGLLYGAVAVASASGNPVSGALGMAAFAAGTIPSLLTVGLAGHAAGRSFRGVMSRVAPIVMAVNAGVLGYMAWRLVG